MAGLTKDSDVSAATASAAKFLQLYRRLLRLILLQVRIRLHLQRMLLKRYNAALGGTSHSAEQDQIDGGSAQDTINVAMDGNFLLGFQL